jgi:hypothetical protein
MQKKGIIRKMNTLINDIVEYHLPLGSENIFMNELLGKTVKFEYLNEIYCIKCGRKTKKSFAQGYCYPCYVNAPETEECVLNPELCRAHEGIARDLEYAKQHCLINHIVYMAESGGLKIGVTRSTQLITRWIDQGATKVIKIAITPNRYLAGLIEVTLKNFYSDKTNWKKMLMNKVDTDVDLTEEKNQAIHALSTQFQSYITDDDEIIVIKYPVLHYPEKVTSVNFEKNKTIEGKLSGIKGQYLIFSEGNVLNIRKHGGYLINIEY